MSERFGVWYDDGHMDVGWLAEEHNHGRQYRAEYLSMAEAEEVAARQRAYDKDTVFYPAPLDSDHEKLFKTVRKLANMDRVKRAEMELERAKRAVKSEEDDDPDPRPTAWERVKKV